MVSNPEVYLLGNTHQYLSFVLFYVIKIDINYSFGLNSASKAFSSRANRICVAWWWCSGYSIRLATNTHGGNVTLVGWQGRQHCVIRVHGTVPTGSIPTGTVPTSATPGHYTPLVKKTRHQSLAHNFTKYLLIFTILSLLDSVVNL